MTYLPPAYSPPTTTWVSPFLAPSYHQHGGGALSYTYHQPAATTPPVMGALGGPLFQNPGAQPPVQQVPATASVVPPPAANHPVQQVPATAPVVMPPAEGAVGGVASAPVVMPSPNAYHSPAAWQQPSVQNEVQPPPVFQQTAPQFVEGQYGGVQPIQPMFMPDGLPVGGSFNPDLGHPSYSMIDGTPAGTLNSGVSGQSIDNMLNGSGQGGGMVNTAMRPPMPIVAGYGMPPPA